MSEKTRVRRFGGSLGILIPETVAECMSLNEGDELIIRNTPDGFSVARYDPEFADAMEDARAFMHSHRNAFRELAK